MTAATRHLLFWTPRILCILLAVFLSLIALDVFGMGLGPGEALLAFLIHLTPTWLVVIATVLAWRRELIGAILFPLLGCWYIVMAWGEHWAAFACISGPLFVIGILFSLNRVFRAQLHPEHTSRH
jgi:hypothetical protein